MKEGFLFVRNVASHDSYCVLGPQDILSGWTFWQVNFGLPDCVC